MGIVSGNICDDPQIMTMCDVECDQTKHGRGPDFRGNNCRWMYPRPLLQPMDDRELRALKSVERAARLAANPPRNLSPAGAQRALQSAIEGLQSVRAKIRAEQSAARS